MNAARGVAQALFWAFLTAAVTATGLTATPAAAQEEDGSGDGWQLDWSVEAKVHLRDSDLNRIPSPFMFTPQQLPPGQTMGFLETVNEGRHFELSTATLYASATLGEWIKAFTKIDVSDLYDRNPTSTDREIDVDEVWLRFGREAEPGRLAERSGVYLKVGKFPHFERQDDRHLESYGLVSTAFNRFEDAGVEVGVDLGRRFYVKGSWTQGNPLFLRDPNALAGDNGLRDQLLGLNVDPELESGFPILYDAEVEDLDVDGELETGFGLGVRLGPEDGRWNLDLLGWAYSRQLAETVELEGTLYGGDLDLLRGPLNLFPFGTITGDDKEEVGANVWFYAGPLSVFGQFVDQEVVGLDRTGFEVEVAWSFELPLRWAIGGRQLFPYVAPAVRYSKLDPDFEGGHPEFPAPSLRWEWEKIDYGVRLGIVPGMDLTLEYADNTFVTAAGDRENNELLTTLRWKI